MAVIELDGLTKEYGSLLANDDLTLQVEQGEIFGYLGPNGAGKTTTIRTLLGFLKPTAGTARILDTDITDRRGLVETKKRVGYLSDEPGFDGQDTGNEILQLHTAVKGDERSEELLERFEPPLDRRVREYSRGNVQKLGLVTAFMHSPDLVILDEPTSGLDPLMQQQFAEFIRNERESGVTVFLSSHILSEVRRLCDRVGIIRNGRLVELEPVETLLRRTGKVVRIDSAEAIPMDVLDIEGVHDLETAQRADRSSTATDNGQVAFTECAFTYTGNINTLLDELRRYELRDITIEEAPLEDVFLQFYGGEGNA